MNAANERNLRKSFAGQLYNRPAELEAVLSVYRQFFDIKAARDGRTEPRGISIEQWRMRDVQRQCEQYLRAFDPTQPAIPTQPASPTSKAEQPQRSGQMALFNGYKPKTNSKGKP
jgi:hypothetical protein